MDRFDIIADKVINYQFLDKSALRKLLEDSFDMLLKEEMRKLNGEGLEAEKITLLKAQLDLKIEMDKIKSSLLNAKVNLKSGVNVDSVWYRKAKSALSIKGSQYQQMSIELIEIRERIKNKKAHNRGDRQEEYVNALKSILIDVVGTKETFKIMKQANGLIEL